MHTCPRLGMVPAPALAILPCGFISFQPWEEQGERQASPGGCSPQVRRTPWAALNTLQLGTHNITSLLAAPLPPAPGSHSNSQTNQHRNVSDWSEGFGQTETAWLVLGSSSPASCKENVSRLLGKAVFSHRYLITAYNPGKFPYSFSSSRRKLNLCFRNRLFSSRPSLHAGGNAQ